MSWTLKTNSTSSPATSARAAKTSAATASKRSVRALAATLLTAAAATAALLGAPKAHAAWEPTKSIEFIVPAGTGGGADQMARFIQGVATKHKLTNQPIVVVNKGGGAATCCCCLQPGPWATIRKSDLRRLKMRSS